MRVRGGAVVSSAVAALTLALCTSCAPTSPTGQDSTPDAPTVSSATTCDQLATAVVDALDNSLSRYDGLDPSDAVAASLAADTDLEELASSAADAAARLGCDPATYADALTAELGRITAADAVQAVVLDAFAQGLGLENASVTPRTLEVATAEDLTIAVSAAAAGSTIRITAGSLNLSDPVVVTRPLTIEGAGAAETTLSSRASGAAIIAAADGIVTVRGLTVRSDADEASVIVVGGGGIDLADAVVTGGTPSAEGAGGFGLVISPQNGAVLLTSVIQGVRFSGNAGGGMLQLGDSAADISDVHVSAGDGCGLCWGESAGGSAVDAVVIGGATGVRVQGDAAPDIEGIVVRGSAVGVAVDDRASPAIADATLRAGVVGIQVAGRAAPVVRGAVAEDAGRAAVLLADEARGAIDDLVCDGGDTALVGVAETAATDIGRTTGCTVVDLVSSSG